MSYFSKLICLSFYSSHRCIFYLQGLNLLLPVVDRVKYVQVLKELAIDIPKQSAITVGEFVGHTRLTDRRTVSFI